MKLLLVIADDIQLKHGADIDRWIACVESEGWVVTPYITPKTAWNNPARLSRVKEIMQWVELRQPNAIQIFGGVARPATGSVRPDGHADARCQWNDLPYAGGLPLAQFTDTQKRLTSSTITTAQNVIGDGRWDQDALPKPKWAVGRVDFSELPALPQRGTVPVGYIGSGLPRVPAVNEHSAISNYLTRNIDYRTGMVQYPKQAHLTNGWLYSGDEDVIPRLQSVRPDISWHYNAPFISPTLPSPPHALQGARVWFYGLSGQSFDYNYHLALPGQPMFGVRMHHSKSYAFDRVWSGNPNQQGSQDQARWLQYFLGVTIGIRSIDEKWLSGTTFADGFMAHGPTHVHDTFLGDITLPFIQPLAPPDEQPVPMTPDDLPAFFYVRDSKHADITLLPMSIDSGGIVCDAGPMTWGELSIDWEYSTDRRIWKPMRH